MSDHLHVNGGLNMAKTKRGEHTRARLIDATTEVVSEHGYSRATTRAIAEAAGVSEATIYRHFSDKIELFFAAVVERHAPVVAWAAELPSRAGTATIEQNLLDALQHLVVLGVDLAPLELAMLADPELARRRRQGDALPPGPPTYLAEYVRAEQALGRIRTEIDAERTSLVLLAALFGIVAGQIGPGGSVDTGLIEATVELVTQGLKPN